MAYVLITVNADDREILTEQFSTYEAAFAVMRSEMECWGNIPHKAFAAGELDTTDEYGVASDGGFSDIGIHRYDWRLIEVGIDRRMET